MDLKKEEIPALTYDQLVNHIRSSWEYDNKEKYKDLSQALKDEFASREPTINYVCPKCEYQKHNENEIRTAGGAFSAVFEIQTEKYRVITCKRCNYSEFYKGNVGIAQQVID